MSIIISKQGQTAQKLDKAEFEKEDYLQNYIHENPESIPVYEIEESKKLLVVAREFPTGSGGESIDALAVDKDGDIYIVETKLYKNPDKRTVVAQALDYGASMWKHINDFDEFINLIDKEVQGKFKMSFQEKAKTFFEIDEEQIKLMLENIRFNLKDGNIKFVILMDSMDERLKDLIIYVNQNSQFDIYAVQLEYYKFQEYEIMIPKMFGVEVKKNIKSSSSSDRFDWDKDSLLAEIKKINEESIRNVLLNLYEFTEKETNFPEFGTGKNGSFIFRFEDPRSKSGKVSAFSVYCEGNNSSIQFTFGNIRKRLGQKFAELYYEKLSEAGFLKKLNKEELIGSYSPGICIGEVFKNKEILEKFKTAILNFIKEVKTK